MTCFMKKYILPHLISSRVVKSGLLTTSSPSLKCGIAGHSSHCLSASLAPALSVPNRIKYLTWSVGHLHSRRSVHIRLLTSFQKKISYSLILSLSSCRRNISTSFSPTSTIYSSVLCHFLSSAFKPTPPSRDPADLPTVCIPLR